MYAPHTKRDVEQMLGAIGIESLDDLCAFRTTLRSKRARRGSQRCRSIKSSGGSIASPKRTRASSIGPSWARVRIAITRRRRLRRSPCAAEFSRPTRPTKPKSRKAICRRSTSGKPTSACSPAWISPTLRSMTGRRRLPKPVSWRSARRAAHKSRLARAPIRTIAPCCTPIATVSDVSVDEIGFDENGRPSRRARASRRKQRVRPVAFASRRTSSASSTR